MVDGVFIQPVVSQCHVNVDVWPVFPLIWDFIAVDGGELVSVSVVFIEDDGVFFRVGV